MTLRKCVNDISGAERARLAALPDPWGNAGFVARIVAQIRRRWPLVRILLRADSGFAREELMAWCEANGVHFLFGLAKTDRLIAEIKAELEGTAAQSRRTGKPARRFKDFRWMTRSSWSRQRRVVAKAEWTKNSAAGRFRLRARGADGLVRGQRRALSIRTGENTAGAEPTPSHGLSCMPPAAGVASDGRVGGRQV